MPRDIRSYFGVGTAGKKPTVIRDDSPPKSKDKERSGKVGGKKTRLVIFDSDSEEDPLPPSPKRQKRFNSSGKKETVSSKATPSLVPINVADVFGSKPVQRIERLPKKNQSPTLGSKKEDGKAVKSCDDTAVSLSTAQTVSPESNESILSEKESDSKVPETKNKEIKSPKKETMRKLVEEVKSETVDLGSHQKHHKGGRRHSIGENETKIECVKTEKTPNKSHEVVETSKEEEKEMHQVSIDSSEKKKRSAFMYQKYLHREGPKHPGSKQIPKGHPNCLSGLVFVVTGVLDSLDREEATALIQKCGGKVNSSVSKNISYIVLGDDPGPSKLEKAKKLGIKELDEDGLLDLVRSRTDEEGNAAVSQQSASSGKKRKVKKEDDEIEDSLPAKAQKLSNKIEDGKATIARKLYYKSKDSELPSASKMPVSQVKTENAEHLNEDFSMWVDKYKPNCTKNIIGQQGEKSNVNKLKRWLSNWDRYHGPGGRRPPRPGPWDKNDDGGYYKAALLSGAPGIGKTTSAHLVCKELGMDAIEMNASDTRSKKLLELEVVELVTNQSLSSFFTHDGKRSSSDAESGRKKVLLMDEVDGMAGNEDRGGISSLIQLIKDSRIPIVCMCNDRAHPKIRSLVGHCYDLRFQRPRMEQIRGAMMTICFKEGLKVSPETLADLISSTNQDVRQVLHQLNMWAGDKNLSLKSEKKRKGLKDVRLGPWDVLRKVFSVEGRKKMDINQQAELFFYDYNLGPLFVFENYPKVSPSAARTMKQKLNLLAQTAESLAQGDIIQRVIRRDNAWKLLPAQAIFSSVLPGSLMEGHLTGQIDFPSFLGKTSTKGKMERLTQEITLHTKMATRATKKSIKLDYLSYLRDAIVRPLVEESRGDIGHGEGVQKAIDFMHGYSLLREDLDSILELTHFPKNPDLMSSVQSKVKAAFTRAYNKETMMTPYSVTMAVKKKRSGGETFDYGSEEEEEEIEEEEETDVTADAMIKVKKPSSSGAGRGKGIQSSGVSRGKGERGRGKRGK